MKDIRNSSDAFSRLVSLTVLLSCLFLFGCSSSERVDDRPNILFILVDDLGKEWVSAYGAENIETPVVDQLAATGTKFNNAWVMPQCTPTRLSFLTGQYPFRHGWVNHWDVPRWGGGAQYDWNRNPSIARVMKDAGYKTAVAGKWQINDFRVQPKAMNDIGFDDFCMWTGGEGNNPPSDERYWDPYIHTKDGSSIQKGKYGDDVFVDFLIDFMGKNKDEPMFLYYPMCLPHTPFVTTPDEPNVESDLDKHKAMVRYVDTLTGRLVKALDDLGLREDTIIVWTTDNGTTSLVTGHLNGRAVQGAKMRTHEAGTCVPFIVNAPGRAAEGKESEALFTVADLLPTFADIAGGELQAGFEYDGISVKEALLGQADHSPHKWILSMGGRNEAKLTDDGVENAFVYRDRVLRTERFKLYVNTKAQPEKLYDLKSDPWEEKNLIASSDKDAQEALAFLSSQLANFPDRDSDPIYDVLPPQPWDVDITAKAEEWKQ